MEPQIVHLDEMTVVGMQSLINTQCNLIAKLWERFLQRYKEISHVAAEPEAMFGVSFEMVEIPSDQKQEFLFFHLVGQPVSSTEDIPEGMTYKRVPAHKYAKFTHKGVLAELEETYKYIFHQWLPTSGYSYEGPVCDLEWYDNRFKLDSEDSEFDIYVPII
jgi:AraC family transcriptional regulator